MAENELVLRNVEVGGQSGLDVHISDGRVAAIGRSIKIRSQEMDGCGGALIPGLVDHHAHLLASAAEMASIRLECASGYADVLHSIRQAASRADETEWLRATGYHESIAGALTRSELDQICPHRPLRVQHQTGALWILNSAALARVLSSDTPNCVELGADGEPTGRIFRGDAWLRERIGSEMPKLAPLGDLLGSYGITGVTDASATTDDVSADYLATAVRNNDLPVKLTLMSRARLATREDGAFAVGPVKILLDDHDLPPLEDLVAIIAQARSWGRSVAFHCVTDGELAIALAALDAAGSLRGDRIEHGSIIPEGALDALRKRELTIVTQPCFVRERGDRYLAHVPAREHVDLYRAASLLNAGIHVAAGSDAPYGGWNPWRAITAATLRKSRMGHAVNASEAIPARSALDLFLKPQGDPSQPARRVRIGMEADLCLLRQPLDAVLSQPDAAEVEATFLDGRLRWRRQGQ